VPNATAGVNTVLRALDLAPGDELLLTDSTYARLPQRGRRRGRGDGARVVIAALPFPLPTSPSRRGRCSRGHAAHALALIDHVTSPTAWCCPIARLVAALAARGVDVLVDGAHAPGMVELDLRALGAAYYTGNCHKWLCAPKGAAFLHVRRDRQARVHPLVTSHGATSPRTDRSRFQLEFRWTGTDDPTPCSALPDALASWCAAAGRLARRCAPRNHALALAARDRLCAALGCAPPAPDAMLGSLAALPLPAARGERAGPVPGLDALQAAPLGAPSHRGPRHALARLAGGACCASRRRSTTRPSQYEQLAAALPLELPRT
jgi:isopenicillin-N epimerase